MCYGAYAVAGRARKAPPYQRPGVSQARPVPCRATGQTSGYGYMVEG